MAKIRPNRINKTSQEQKMFMASFTALSILSKGLKKDHEYNSKASQRATS